jgi:DNA-directed RNA polymerase beta subunit
MPQKKTRTAKKPLKRKTKTAMTAKKAKSLKILNRTPTPYPFSVVSPITSPSGKQIGAITSSSTSMRAVSHDGKNWHIDTDVNGVKKHADITNLAANPKNLTNLQIMDILAYPAAKQDLKTRLLEEFRNIRQPLMPMLAQRFGEPQIQYKYIYKNGCANKPVMIHNLSPLHEAKIVPDSSIEPIHLVDVSLGVGKGARRSIKPLKKGRAHTKGKKYRKPRK